MPALAAAPAAATGSLAAGRAQETLMASRTHPRACSSGCSGSTGSGSGLAPLPLPLPRQQRHHQHGARRRSRAAVAVQASADGAGDVLQTRELAEQRRRALLSYVKQVQPALIERFVERGPPAVVGAMRHTIQNLLGTLPPQFFSVTINTVGENLSQLMLSVMMTGVLLRNLQYRLDLRSALGGGDVDGASAAAVTAAAGGGNLARAASAPAAAAAAAAAMPEHLDERLYAPGTQKGRVEGDVLLWHLENGVEKLDAKAYITMLEQEVARLRTQLGAGSSSGGGGSSTLAGSLGGSVGSSGSESGDEVEQQQPPSPSAASAASASQQQQPSSAAAASPLRPLPAPLSQQQLAALGSSAGGVATSAAGLLLHGGGGEQNSVAASNELLDYLRRLDASGVAELTGSTGPEVAAAMDHFVLRLMGSDREALTRAGSECTAQELARVMFWCLVVGYTLRGMEVRFELVQRAGGAVASWAGADAWQVW